MPSGSRSRHFRNSRLQTSRYLSLQKHMGMSRRVVTSALLQLNRFQSSKRWTPYFPADTAISAYRAEKGSCGNSSFFASPLLPPNPIRPQKRFLLLSIISGTPEKSIELLNCLSNSTKLLFTRYSQSGRSALKPPFQRELLGHTVPEDMKAVSRAVQEERRSNRKGSAKTRTGKP